jgi:hypothetical protein
MAAAHAQPVPVTTATVSPPFGPASAAPGDAGTDTAARAATDSGVTADRVRGADAIKDTTASAKDPPLATGTLVPLYSDPSHSSWQIVIEAKMAHPSVPVVAVFNPASGPGSGVSAAYVAGVAKLRAAGITVLGYVATTYARRPEASVKADIDRYRSWYPQTTGIFFDEQTNIRGGEEYYARLNAYARSKGFTFTVGNPGADSSASYIGTVDLILVYESAGLPSAGALGGWHASYDRRNFGIIPYGVPAMDSTFIATAKKQVGYIYITHGTLPNPWANVPSYFSTLLGELAN